MVHQAHHTMKLFAAQIRAMATHADTNDTLQCPSTELEAPVPRLPYNIQFKVHGVRYGNPGKKKNSRRKLWHWPAPVVAEAEFSDEEVKPPFLEDTANGTPIPLQVLCAYWRDCCPRKGTPIPLQVLCAYWRDCCPRRKRWVRFNASADVEC